MKPGELQTTRRTLRLKEVAELTGLSTRHLRGLVRSGALVGVRAGPRTLLVTAEDLECFLAERRTTA
jgi:excisionase family DNA binding protein